MATVQYLHLNKDSLLLIFVQYHVYMYIQVHYISYLFDYIVCLLLLLLCFCNILSLRLLWQTNFPVCGTIKEY